MELRTVSDADLPFVAEMALMAAFPPGPLPVGASEMARVTRWTADWGRTGDAGVVAWQYEERIGAAWCRIQSEVKARDDAGDPIPEVAIAVSIGHRGRGFGAAMLNALASAAVGAGMAALSLSVNDQNPALHLYERAGFEVVRREGGNLTMVKPLGGDSR